VGKAPTIEQQEKDNADFTRYLTQCRDNARAAAAKDIERFEANIDSTYPVGERVLRLGSGETCDYQQVDDFSLKNIESTIVTCAKALVGGHALPGGILDIARGEDASAAIAGIATMSAFTSLGATVALSAIVSLLGQMGATAELNTKTSWKMASVAPGLDFHVFVSQASYTQQEWLHGKSMVSYLLKYKLIYSASQFKGAADMATFNAQFKELEKDLSSINAQNARVNDAILAAESEDEFNKATFQQRKFKALLDMLGSLRARTKAIQDEYMSNKS